MARVLSKGRKKLAFIPKSAAATAALARSLVILNGEAGLNASDYALADGFQLGFGEPVTADSTPIGSPRNTSVVGEGDVIANVNFARDTDPEADEAWEFYQTVDVPFWAVLRDGPKLATAPWALEDEVDVFDLSTTDPNPRQDAEVWSFNVVHGQGVGHERRVKITA